MKNIIILIGLLQLIWLTADECNISQFGITLSPQSIEIKCLQLPLEDYLKAINQNAKTTETPIQVDNVFFRFNFKKNAGQYIILPLDSQKQIDNISFDIFIENKKYPCSAKITPFLSSELKNVYKIGFNISITGYLEGNYTYFVKVLFTENDKNDFLHIDFPQNEQINYSLSCELIDNIKNDNHIDINKYQNDYPSYMQINTSPDKLTMTFYANDIIRYIKKFDTPVEILKKPQQLVGGEAQFYFNSQGEFYNSEWGKNSILINDFSILLNGRSYKCNEEAIIKLLEMLKKCYILGFSNVVHGPITVNYNYYVYAHIISMENKKILRITFPERNRKYLFTYAI